MVRVWATEGPTGSTLLIDREQGANPSLLVIEPGRPISERWSLPETAEELVNREEAIEEITREAIDRLSERLEEADISAKAWRTVSSILDELRPL